MCIAIGTLDPASDQPLVVAANRDEFYERQGEVPRLQRGEPHDVLAPRDPRAGGTWIGINRAGLVALITNRLSRSDRDSDAPSRGRLVRALLEQAGTCSEARRVIKRLDPSRFNPFSLLVVDPTGMVSVSHRPEDGDQWDRHDRGSFLVSTEKGFEHRDDPPFWVDAPGMDAPEPRSDRLEDLLSRHAPFRHRPAICRHDDAFGTLSSTVMILDRRAGPRIRFAQGSPCIARFRGVSVPDSFAEDVRTAWRTSAPA